MSEAHGCQKFNVSIMAHCLDVRFKRLVVIHVEISTRGNTHTRCEKESASWGRESEGAGSIGVSVQYT